MFEKEKILLHLEGTLTPQTFEWPFQFTFPTHVQRQSNRLPWPPRDPFDSETSHLLPPTFAANVKNESWEIESLVIYQIQAEVSKPQRIFMGKSPLFQEVVPLRFVLLAISEEKGNVSASRQQFFTVHSLLLLPENRGKKLGVQEKLNSWLSPSQLPRFKFRVTFTYPSRMCQSAPLAYFDPMMEDSTVTSVPPVFIESVSLTLVSQTAARTSPSLLGVLSGEVEERYNIVSKESFRVPFTHQIELGQVFGELSLQHPEPSFRTFNICRSYKLCANVTLGCPGKTVNLALNDLDIRVLPDTKKVEGFDPEPIAELNNGPAETAQHSTSMQPPAVVGDDGDPPPYELASSVSTVTVGKDSW